MNENNSEEMDKKDINEENQNPEIKEEINVQKNIEKNVETNIEKKKVIETVEKIERKGKDESKKEKNNSNVNVQYRKPSIFSGILLVIIGILIATVAFLVWHLFSEETNNNADANIENNQGILVAPDEENKSVVPKELDLSLEGEFVTSLYNKIPMVINEITDTSDSIIYSTEKKSQANISDYEKMAFVFKTMEENGKYTEVSLDGIKDRLEINQVELEYIDKVQKYERADVEKEYKSIFGNDKDILLQDIKITSYNYNAEYDSTDDCFYGHSFGLVGNTTSPYKTKLESVQTNEDNTEVYLYDYIIFADAGSGYRLYKTRADVTNRTYFAEETYDMYSQGKIKDEIIEKYKDQLIEYKHTFKIDETGNYYWYSTEPVY